MDPITAAIVAALAAGVAEGAGATAYKALKEAIQKKFGKDSKLAQAVEIVEDEPEFEPNQATLAGRVEQAEAVKDEELIKLAQQLLKAVEETAQGEKILSKYDIRVDGGQAGVIGANAHVEGGINTYTSEGGMFLGDVQAGGDVAGGDMTKTYTQNPDPEAIASAFSKIYAQVAQKPDLAPQDKADVQEKLQEVEAELKKGEDANESFIQSRLRNIQRMAPDILDVVLTTFANPVLGMGMVAKKVAGKMKAEAGSEPEAE